ncbi:60S acidic ribosomal protein P0 [Myotis davidii]|uniref:Large ribosomal subunit protein uL10 n=1 Tax=Myotis davidii TaxID=225400 RepID=L5MA84_MYODS|nr:60S acidic ribosomal protein P0 [Myotis davidii]
MSLRGKAVVLMGKNSMMSKTIQGHLENSPAPENLWPDIQGNVGFVFTKEDLTEISDMLLADQVPAAACAGAMAPCEVTVPAQNTGLGAEKTSFFQALGITTNISKGSIEVLSDAQLVETGDKVGASAATQLHMLNISPFSSGLIVQQVFDNGRIYNPEVLDITEETAFPLPGGCPQCCQRMPSHWLPNCCISIPFYHQWVQASSAFVCGD